jgi:hypothetical protein
MRRNRREMGPRDEYTVRATRFQDWWYVEVPSLDLLVDCRFFSEVEPTVRYAISQAVGVEPNETAIAIELQPAWEERLRYGA